MVPTLRRSPIVNVSPPALRNWNDDRRDATKRPSIWVSAPMSSSARPSQKWPWSWAGLRSAKGRTAIDGSGRAGVGLTGSAASVPSSRIDVSGAVN